MTKQELKNKLIEEQVYPLDENYDELVSSIARIINDILDDVQNEINEEIDWGRFDFERFKIMWRK